ncbi:HNH endonuclease [Nocardia africana]|uniref:HNH endonuclease n=1 Tax=Nocardia africana TaxID=134964 RepID=A0ABW6NL57_9NOCA
MSEFDVQGERRAWLALLKQDYRRLDVDTRYDDDAANHYSWDNRVPNHLQVKVGDIIAVWDEHELLGISVIESIEHGTGTKVVSRCPHCKKTNLERRKTLTPEYRCYNCKKTFNEPVLETVDVETFRSNHGQSWVPLPGTLRAEDLRALCKKTRSQNSFRELQWAPFLTAIRLTSSFGNPLVPLEATAAQLRGGHTIRPVRVRIGQTGFRAELLRRFGPKCAFSGSLPEPALDACHLYSYADVGHHDPHGGILLRRDLHTLFDRGLIAVDGDSRIDVTLELRKFQIYANLHGKGFEIEPDGKQKQWLQLHWHEFRK